MRYAKLPSLALLAFLWLPIGASAEAGKGISAKQLHEQHCLACHTTGIYTRPTRFISTKGALHAQVARCAREAARVDWSEAQVDAVTEYLNDRYYGF